MSLWDLANSDCIVVMGSNMAENHPVGFRFVLEAKDRGATIIHVDPRFTRTSALADLYAPIRSGSDIAFLGGIIRHILENDLWFRDYALNYTNLATIIDERYRDTEDLGGVFSGWSDESHTYKNDSWQYEGEQMASPLAEHHTGTGEPLWGVAGRDKTGPEPQDLTLQHPRCVYQIMRRHYARYTPEMVERATGCPKETFLKVCAALARNSGRERTGAFCYAVGWTHHTTGVQIIRAATIIQGLLGNVGRPGGGILALRGHCSIQGSTDIPTLYNMLPTYLPQPNVHKPHHTFKDFLAAETVPTGWWHNFPKYMVSLLKAWYGDAAQRENDWGYDFLPKLTGDHSQQPTTLAMADGVVKGLFVLGQNPVIGAVNSELVQRGLAKLEWMVVRDFAMTETAEFLEGGPPRAQGGHALRGHRDGDLLLAERDGGGEGRDRHQHQPAGAMARQGVRSGGRQPLRPVVPVSSGPAPEAALRAQRREAGRAHAGAHLGLPRARREAGAGPGSGAQGDQRLYLAGTQADRDIQRAEGRRHDGVRRLAVHWRLSEGGGQSGALAGAGRARRAADASRLGVLLAVQPPRTQRWPGKSGQSDKWGFCLTRAKMAVGQER